MEKMNDLRDLLKHEIEDLYSVEEQIIEALPKMIEKANNKTLKSSLSEHLKVTKEQKKRLDKIMKMMEMETEGDQKKGFLSGLFSGSHVCKGMKGIIEEGNKIMGEDMSTEVLDAAIIACAQKVEHYEICGYGTARTYARELGLEQVAKMLEQSLAEEYEADDTLTDLAISRVNVEAETANGQSGDKSASGANQRSGRETTRERARMEEMEMEAVNSRRGSAKTSASSGSSSGSERTDHPKSSGSAPRSNGPGRGAASSKRSTGNSHSTKAASKTSARSSSNGRSGSSGRGSSTRGRK